MQASREPIIVSRDEPHVQVLAAQWMPFTLYALRRHLETGSGLSLAGFAAAAVALVLLVGVKLYESRQPSAAAG